jgi:hypothetical protein
MILDVNFLLRAKTDVQNGATEQILIRPKH